jgi:polar amino acid transport system substrate-binding protein
MQAPPLDVPSSAGWDMVVLMKRSTHQFLVAGVALSLLTGCGMSVPADPEATLETVRGDTLRVGVSPNPPWTDLREDADPAGTEPALVERFASSLDADIEWTEGGEETLVTKLERGQLDLVIGGLTDQSPWVDKAALTVPYTEVRDDEGKAEKHVMAARLGENAFLVELETFLLDSGADE